MAKKIKQLTFRDLGKKVDVVPFRQWQSKPAKVQIVMAIKAPRGRCFLFKSFSPLTAARQAEAIRTFMQQHKGGRQ